MKYYELAPVHDARASFYASTVSTLSLRHKLEGIMSNDGIQN